MLLSEEGKAKWNYSCISCMKTKNLQGKQPGMLGTLGHKTTRITGENPSHNTS